MIRIGYYKEFIELNDPELAEQFPAMTDSFLSKPIKNKNTIIKYLHSGNIDTVCMQEAQDVFTGESIGFRDYGRSDGTYKWPECLAYYVDKYNLQLPDDFIQHILNQTKKP